jgi:tRNA 2-selenouridine synthase
LLFTERRIFKMSPRLLTSDEFQRQAANSPVFDVRSPGEYRKAHIPGAINLPLFSDEERHELGILYKQTGRQAVIMRGLEIVGPRLTDYILQVQNSTSAREILLHCWRGGMRSESLAWLLEKAGYRVGLLKGGYKAYRKLVVAASEAPLRLLVLGGMTGSGKTEVLQILRKRGQQVLDLEGLARHRGSAFGAMGDGGQPTSEQFENEIFATLEGFDRNRLIWVEDESRRIGRVLINEALFRQMRGATLVKIQVSREARVARLCRDYGGVAKDRLAAAVSNIAKRLGGKKTGEVLRAVGQGDYQQAANAILDYYDKTYLYGISRRNPEAVVELDPTLEDPAEIAEALIVKAKELGESG